MRRSKSRIVLPLAALLGALALAGCNTDGSGPTGSLAQASVPDKAPEPPMTRARAATECWMKTDKGRGDTDLDKRADIVTKCIAAKLKAAPAAPRT